MECRGHKKPIPNGLLKNCYAKKRCTPGTAALQLALSQQAGNRRHSTDNLSLACKIKNCGYDIPPS
jgi:hypothetical protein